MQKFSNSDSFFSSQLLFGLLGLYRVGFGIWTLCYVRFFRRLNDHALTQVAKRYLSLLRRVVKSARSFSNSANVHVNIGYLHLSIQREMTPIKALPNVRFGSLIPFVSLNNEHFEASETKNFEIFYDADQGCLESVVPLLRHTSRVVRPIIFEVVS